MTRPIKSDSRYTITQEFTGHISGKPVHVLRFCGEFVDSSPFQARMITRAIGHNAARKGALIVTEKTA